MIAFIRCLGRGAHDLDILGAEHFIEQCCELLSQSRIRDLNDPTRSPRSISRFLACWVTHLLVGLAVTLRTCTLLVAHTTTAKQYSGQA
jgi:hypothetical protein